MTVSAKVRKSLPASRMGKPGSDEYPMPDKRHAAIAKGFAAMHHDPDEAAIDAKADKILARAYGGKISGGASKPSLGRPGRWKGGADTDKLGQKDVWASDAPGYGDAVPGEREYYNFIRGGLGTTAVGAPRGKGGIGSDATAEPTNQATGGRVGRGGKR